MRFGPRLALLCLLLLAATAPLAAVEPAAATPAGQPEANETLAPESTTLTVQLRADGDATWTVSTAFVLEDENDTQAFERLAADFEAGNSDATFDIATFERAAGAASEATGREMRIRNVRYDTPVNETENTTVGRLVVRFRWTNFTEEAGNRIRVGDAFNTTDGTWLPGLTSRQTLVVRPPPAYSVETAPVPPRDGVLRWEGPTSFEPGYLGQVVYTGETPTPSPSPTPTPTPNGPDGPSLGAVELIGGGLLVLAAFALGGYALARRDGDPFDGAPAGTDGSDPGAGTGAAETSDTAGAAAGAADEPVDDEPDTELLSDEERVEHLLESNGGRMKQATIVEETGWSNAKVSQLLSAMDEEGQVNKLRIGRENLISLPDEEVAEFGDDGDGER